jgi:hypothetical protein
MPIQCLLSVWGSDHISKVAPWYGCVAEVDTFSDSSVDSRSFWNLTRRLSSGSHSGSGVVGVRGGQSWGWHVSEVVIGGL